MNNPLQRLKFLPWIPLLQVAALTALLATALDFLLISAANQLEAIARTLSLLLSPPLGLFVVFLVAVGVGALAVYLLERVYPQLSPNTAVLWALVPCLALILFIRSFIPIPAFLVSISYPQLIGMILGIFWKGRGYWR
ncbi:MAG: peptide chain release factor 1 [Cyanothece sp. SIO1E1]|nr:peptide chain release factor 1 [Cyanothece sp. SIO1E1]